MVWEGGITLFMVFLILSQKQDKRAKARLTLIKRYENGDSEDSKRKLNFLKNSTVELIDMSSEESEVDEEDVLQFKVMPKERPLEVSQLFEKLDYFSKNNSPAGNHKRNNVRRIRP